MADISSDRESSRRLNSWKEIAAFFGKHERTVKRWEVSRGLPVRRVPGGTRTSVFAYASELDQWLAGKGADTARPANADQSPPAATTFGPLARLGGPYLAALALFVVALAVATSTAVPNLLQGGAPAASANAGHVPPPAAQELYLSAVYDWNTRTAAGLNRAVESFTAALELDPGFARAEAGLANAYNLLSQYSLVPGGETYPKAKIAAERAIALDPTLAEGYAALAFAEFYGFHHFAYSASLFERALELDPDSAQTHHWYALTAMHMGGFDEPLEHIDRALALTPESRAVRANKALILFHAGRVEEAVDILTGMKQAYPDFLATPSYLATIYLAERRYADFLREYGEAAKVEQNPARLAIAAAAWKGFEQGGGDGLLRAMLAEQRARYAAGTEPAYKLAGTAAMLGDTRLALGYLTLAVEHEEPDVLGMRIDPAFVPLHADPAFRDLLHRVGLPLP